MHNNSLILIVEDNPELGARLTRDVRRYGGAEAAELVQEYDEAIARLLNEPAPRAVVMEYRMRAHTGVDLALWMAAGTPGGHTRATAAALVARIRRWPTSDLRACRAKALKAQLAFAAALIHLRRSPPGKRIGVRRVSRTTRIFGRREDDAAQYTRHSGKECERADRDDLERCRRVTGS